MNYQLTADTKEREALFNKLVMRTELIRNSFEDYLSFSLKNMDSVLDTIETCSKEEEDLSNEETDQDHINPVSFVSDRGEKDLVLTNILKNIRESINELTYRKEKSTKKEQIDTLMIQLDHLLNNVDKRKTGKLVPNNTFRKKIKPNSNSINNRKKTIKNQINNFFSTVYDPGLKINSIMSQTRMSDIILKDNKDYLNQSAKMKFNLTNLSKSQKFNMTDLNFFNKEKKRNSQSKKLMHYLKDTKFNTKGYFNVGNMSECQNKSPSQKNQQFNTDRILGKSQKISDLKEQNEIKRDNEELKDKLANLKDKYDKRREYINKMYDVIKAQEIELESLKGSNKGVNKEILNNSIYRLDEIKHNCYSRISVLNDRIEYLKDNVKDALVSHVTSYRDRLNSLSLNKNQLQLYSKENLSIIEQVKKNIENHFQVSINKNRDLTGYVNDIINRIEQLKRENDRISEENHKSKSQYQQLQLSMNRFKESSNESKQTNSKLIRTNSELNDQNRHLRTENKKLSMIEDKFKKHKVLIDKLHPFSASGSGWSGRSRCRRSRSRRE